MRNKARSQRKATILIIAHQNYLHASGKARLASFAASGIAAMCCDGDGVRLTGRQSGCAGSQVRHDLLLAFGSYRQGR